MTFRSLALKNIKENWRSYSAFFLSSLFSVAIFYIYYAFIVHPDVVNGQIFAGDKIAKGMMYCLYIISIFSFIFIMYSSGSFLKSRKKEFGLLSLFGMTSRQLRRLVFIENMIIGMLSTVFGIVVGNLFSKLFLMCLGALLDLNDQIRFVIPVKAVVVTIVVFISMFLVNTIYTTMRLKQGQIIDLLRAHKQPKGELTYSKFKVIIGFFCLIAGYVLAATMTIMTVLVVALPIIILVVIATYLLYTQLSIVVLQLLKKNKKLFYNRSNLIVISQLGYKIKDNARILFTITILSAVVMTAMGTIYVIQMLGKDNSSSPYALSWVESAEARPTEFKRSELEQMIGAHDLKVKKEASITGIKLEAYKIDGELNASERSEREYMSAMIIPTSTYNEMTKTDDKLTLQDDEAVYITWMMNLDFQQEQSKFIQGYIGEEKIQLNVKEIRKEVVMNFVQGWNLITVIVSDEHYEQLSHMSSAVQFTVHGVEFSKWKDTIPMLEQLRTKVLAEHYTGVDYSRNLDYHQFIQFTSLTIFIGVFICLLFFIAAGSLIYFKLFTERDEDIEMFKGLSRIGMTYKEMRKIVTTQVAIIFFLPCVIGIIHALFAMFALDGVLDSSAWSHSIVVFGIYILMQAIYFIITSVSYLKSIRKGSITSTN